MADRIGVINKGELIICEEKAKLMQKLGKRQLTLSQQEPLSAIPEALASWALALKGQGHQLEYTYDARDGRPDDISLLLRKLGDLGIGFKDLHTKESSLEEIFVDLVHSRDDVRGSRQEARS
jgi:ABC-2 type transport system ATP-binding protein